MMRLEDVLKLKPDDRFCELDFGIEVNNNRLFHQLCPEDFCLREGDIILLLIKDNNYPGIPEYGAMSVIQYGGKLCFVIDCDYDLWYDDDHDTCYWGEYVEKMFYLTNANSIDLKTR